MKLQILSSLSVEFDGILPIDFEFFFRAVAMNETELQNIVMDGNRWANLSERPYARAEYLARIEQLFSQRTATMLFGIRMAGKSSLIRLFIMQRIGRNERQAKDTLIVNFEDPRFVHPLSSDDLLKIYETYLKHCNPSQPLVVLDEAQNVQGWEKFVRYLLEAKKAHVVVTGSSSKALSQEMATVLTGRHVDIEVFPLSFQEFLQFNGLTIASEVEIARHRITIKRLFEEYAQWGGFPEVVLSESLPRKRELLRRYFEDIIFKDVVKRYGIKEIEKLEQLAGLLISNMATLQSVNRIKDRLGTSLDTVQRFIGYLENARMFSTIRKFDYSLGQQLRSMSKVYVADPGLYSAKGFKFSENYGHIAENLVAIELLRKRAFNPILEVYYWKDQQQREVDFVVKEGIRVQQLIQVCWNLSEAKTREREVRNLVRAGIEMDCDDLLLITADEEATETVSQNGASKTIHIVPLWRWLLSCVREEL